MWRSWLLWLAAVCSLLSCAYAPAPTRRPTPNPTPVPTYSVGVPTPEPTISFSPTFAPSWPKPTGQPTSQPTQPTGQPTTQPSRQPTGQPTSQPTQPTGQPTTQPSSRPSGQPTGQPSGQPTGQPSGSPTTSRPTPGPGSPTLAPTVSPTALPTATPTTSSPTASVPVQTPLPTGQPTTQPSGRPSVQPTEQPSGQPSGRPSGQPTGQPSGSPTTSRPTTSRPTPEPGSPTLAPTVSPTREPSATPTTSRPTPEPGSPTLAPTVSPPTAVPTSFPSTEERTEILFEVDHILFGVNVAAFSCVNCWDVFKSVVQASIPVAKIRQNSLHLLHSRAATRRRLSSTDVDLRYRGKFIAEDVGFADPSAAFAFVKGAFESSVSSQNFTVLMRKTATKLGSTNLLSVTSTSAVMKRVVEESSPDYSNSDIQDSGFFDKLPLYGKWLFSLGMCAIVIGLLWFGHNKVYRPYYASKGQEPVVQDFDNICVNDSEESAWGAASPSSPADVQSPISSGHGSGGDEDTPHHTPLSARIPEMSHQYMNPPLPLLSTVSVSGDSSIIARTLAHQLDSGTSGDGELVFGY